MKIVENRKYAVFALAAFLSFAAYALYLQYLPDPRFNSGPIGLDRMYWWEIVHWAIASVVVLVLFFAALGHAYERGKTKWLIFILLVWPSMFYYSWKQSESV
jgi:hypothetical protein